MSDDPKCTVCGLGDNAYLRCQYAGCPDGRDLPTLRPTDAARAEIARLTAERDAARDDADAEAMAREELSEVAGCDVARLTAERDAEREARKRLVEAVAAAEGWIVDGGYLDGRDPYVAESAAAIVAQLRAALGGSA